ncbi:MAG: DUF3570 domain-containing protein [Chlorobiaceae bacterium]|nr:DUF3570 domain-containing protein [Chlorobiaceae bacterium]
MTPVFIKNSAVFSAALLGAVMAMPSLKPLYADSAPERGIVSLKYLNYQDWQTGDTPITAGMTRDRIGVQALSLMGMVPIAGEWSLNVTLLEDLVTGASPAYHSSGFPSTVSAASALDLRHAGDLQLTRYFSRGSLSGGFSFSQENDYISRGISLQGSWETEDKNTTLTLGGSYSSDTIDLGGEHVVPSKKQDTPENKKVYAGLLGITRVLTKSDIIQFNLGYTSGKGYYTDPFKDPDQRPGDRNSATFMTRWNHHFDGTDGTLHLSYRYYGDSWGINAHTLGAEFIQPLPYGLTLTPEVRFYSQSAADFYVPVGNDEKDDPSVATAPPSGAVYYSEDQRLSSFGAYTLGLKIGKKLGKSWLMDAKYERYEQRDEWSLFGKGDPGVATFNARNFQLGVSREF